MCLSKETPKDSETKIGTCCKPDSGDNNFCSNQEDYECSDTYEEAPYKWHAHCPGIMPKTCGGHIHLIPIDDK